MAEQKAQWEKYRQSLGVKTRDKNRPANVPQQSANQALHARYAAHARAFFLSDFVSIENKEAMNKIPKLKVASSSLVARSNS